MITEQEQIELNQLAKSTTDIEEAVFKLENALKAQGWRWRTQEWGYATEHWTTLIRNGSRASVQTTSQFRQIKVEVRDATGDKLEQKILVGEWTPRCLKWEDDEDELEDF